MYKERVRECAKEKTTLNDPAHDFNHALRFWANAEFIAKREHERHYAVREADRDVLFATSFLHDIFCPPKNDPLSDKAPQISAEMAKEILNNNPDFPKDKIEAVKEAIANCSFSNSEPPRSPEEAIARDADLLEQTGAIAFARTCTSGGAMGRALYNPDDPLCERRSPESLKYTFDFFRERSFVVTDKMNTLTGQRIAMHRTEYLIGQQRTNKPKPSLFEEIRRELEELEKATLTCSTHDLELLERTGVIAFAKFCMKGGEIGLPIYEPLDPFSERHLYLPNHPKFIFDFFVGPEPVYVVSKMIEDPEAKKSARRQTKFLRDNLVEELRRELQGL
jgi:uncharacterized protein